MKGRRYLRPNDASTSRTSAPPTSFNEGPEISPAKPGLLGVHWGPPWCFNEGPEISPAKRRPAAQPHRQIRRFNEGPEISPAKPSSVHSDLRTWPKLQ